MVEKINHTNYLSTSDFLVVEQKGDLKKIDISILDTLKSKDIELQRGATSIQWRLVGDPVWNNLISLNDLVGAKGKDAKNLELRNSNGVIQWRNVGENWIDLVTIENLMPKTFSDGKKIPDLEPTEHVNLEDYVILEQADGTKKVELSILNSTENIIHKDESNNINTVKATLDEFNEEVNTVKSSLDKVNEDIDTVKSSLDEFNDHINNHPSSNDIYIGEDTPNNEEIKVWIDTSDVIIETNNTIQGSILEEIQNIFIYLKDKIKSLEEKNVELESRVSYLEVNGSLPPTDSIGGNYLLSEDGFVILYEDEGSVILEEL